MRLGSIKAHEGLESLNLSKLYLLNLEGLHREESLVENKDTYHAHELSLLTLDHREVPYKAEQHIRGGSEQPETAKLPVSFGIEGSDTLTICHDGLTEPLSAFARVCKDTGSVQSMDTAEPEVKL